MIAAFVGKAVAFLAKGALAFAIVLLALIALAALFLYGMAATARSELDSQDDWDFWGWKR